VHMPSHVYMRIGDYERAAEANRKAIEVDRVYLDLAKPEGVYPMMYYPHNIHFLWAAASMEGRSAEAIDAARQVAALLDADMLRQMGALEYYDATLLFALTRFAKWDELLEQPEPPADLAVLHALWVYTRGLAFAGTGRFNEAKEQLAALRVAAAKTPADRIVATNAPARQLLQLAQHDLAGEIAARQRRYDEAIRQLEEAVSIQDRLPYDEPPPWYFPERQALGRVLLDAGRPSRALAVYRADLRRNPNNVWSVCGSARALEASGNKEEARQAGSRCDELAQSADVKITASRF